MASELRHRHTIRIFTPIDRVLKKRDLDRLSHEVSVRKNYLATLTEDSCKDCVRLGNEIEQISGKISRIELGREYRAERSAIE